MSGTRNPGPYAILELLKMAEKGGIDISRHEANSTFDGINAYMKKNKSRELVRILELYSRMTGVGKKKFMNFAGKIR